MIIIISSKKTIGGGDIKMICAMTFFFGIRLTVTAIIAACITGIIYAIAAKFIVKLPDFNKHFAFLPFVEVGYITALLIELF
ncbi:MAG: prepilin peptidase [Oscillospiraceae bacterium]